MMLAPDVDTELGEALAKNEARIAQAIADFIRGNVSADYPPSRRPARRDAHPKAHGCVRATFEVEPVLPPDLARGMFVPGKTYSAWVRFSNGDGDPTRADDKGDAHGMAIKLLGVPGRKLLEREADAGTQDFVMIDHPVFVVDEPGIYLTLLRRLRSKNPLVRALAPLGVGLRGALNAAAITRKRIASPLQARYWSTTAYQLGSGPARQAIKFSAKPLTPALSRAQPTGPNFLRRVLAEQLAERTHEFEFLVQPRTRASLSVECSRVEWREADAPFFKVATLRIPRQQFDSPAQQAFCENLSFNPWHALPEHRPLGRVNRVRRVVYEQVSALRHELNGVVRAEPTADDLPGDTRAS